MANANAVVTLDNLEDIISSNNKDQLEELILQELDKVAEYISVSKSKIVQTTEIEISVKDAPYRLVDKPYAGVIATAVRGALQGERSFPVKRKGFRLKQQRPDSEV